MRRSAALKHAHLRSDPDVLVTLSAIDALADRVRTALESADLEQFADLLDPRVTWGTAGDPSPSCQSRQQVLAWYERGKADGRRAQVLSVQAHGDKILVALRVTSSAGDAAAERWQVLTVGGGRITDIRGYDDEAEACTAAELPG